MYINKRTTNSIFQGLVVELTNFQAEQLCGAALITPQGSVGNGRPNLSTGEDEDSKPDANTASKSNNILTIPGMNLDIFFPPLPARKLSGLSPLSLSGKTSKTTTPK